MSDTLVMPNVEISVESEATSSEHTPRTEESRVMMEVGELQLVANPKRLRL